jgi:uncharacterized protein YbjQ (UPF0145 family)
MITCPKCGHQNKNGVRNCANCRVNLEWAFKHIDQFESETRLAEEREKLAQRKASLLLTTTHFIEGRAIAQYLDIVTAEVVIGTGLLSELGAGIADLLGTRAEGFQQKLQEFRSTALDELRNNAFHKGADAVIGVDIDYMTLANNALVIVASGTAVRLVSLEQDSQIKPDTDWSEGGHEVDRALSNEHDQ